MTPATTVRRRSRSKTAAELTVLKELEERVERRRALGEARTSVNSRLYHSLHARGHIQRNCWHRHLHVKLSSAARACPSRTAYATYVLSSLTSTPLDRLVTDEKVPESTKKQEFEQIHQMNFNK